jgi:hypothetical protein
VLRSGGLVMTILQLSPAAYRSDGSSRMTWPKSTKTAPMDPRPERLGACVIGIRDDRRLSEVPAALVVTQESERRPMKRI